MKIGKRIGLGVLLVAVLLAAAVIVPSMGASPDVSKTKSEKALEYIAQKHAVPKERLMITNEKEANFPLSNQKIWSVKALDTKTTDAYLVNLDEAGNIADIKAARDLEITKYKEKYGKKEIELHEKLQKMNPDDTVEVGIWLTPVIEAPMPDGEISDEQYNKIMDSKRKAYAQKEKPILDILKAKNINIRYASQYAPLIFAQVPARSMGDIENIQDVEGIYVARQFKPLLNTVAQTVKVQPVWTMGITGSGIKVAVVEKGRPTTENPYLTPGPSYGTSGASSHTTAVAGIIASTHSTYQGISYGVPALLSANAGSWQESDMIAASDWAITNGANILSNSWGDDTGLIFRGIDRYFDHVVWDNRKTVTVAAGNNDSDPGCIYCGTGNVYSPGLGYNVITVGGFDDKDTSIWSDDIMWFNSSYKNPITPHMDREKPEVAAVATHGTRPITSTSIAYPWVSSVGGAGTSFAAPAVAAEAALLMQAKSSLTTSPEAVKAIIMASAVHNIEGNSRLSDKDGAGGIDISNAYYTANNNRFTGEKLFASNFPKTYAFYASAGQKVRVVIAWDSHPDSNHPPTSDILESDLDLYILNPSGTTIGFSSSYDNSYEIVEFTAQTTGTFTARINKYGSAAYEYIGFAYTYV